jgi:hypothetical protein
MVDGWLDGCWLDCQTKWQGSNPIFQIKVKIEKYMEFVRQLSLETDVELSSPVCTSSLVG